MSFMSWMTIQTIKSSSQYVKVQDGIHFNFSKLNFQILSPWKWVCNSFQIASYYKVLRNFFVLKKKKTPVPEDSTGWESKPNTLPKTRRQLWPRRPSSSQLLQSRPSLPASLDLPLDGAQETSLPDLTPPTHVSPQYPHVGSLHHPTHTAGIRCPLSFLYCFCDTRALLSPMTLTEYGARSIVFTRQVNRDIVFLLTTGPLS